MKFQIFLLSVFIFSAMILVPSYAQEMPSPNIKIFQLIHNETHYDIPYVLSEGNINTIDLDPDAIRISLSGNEHSGFMEINIPSEFYKMLPCVNPQTDYPDYFIEIFGEIVKGDITRIGSRETLSFDLPANSSQITISCTQVAGSYNSLQLDAKINSLESGNEVEINGLFSHGFSGISNETIRLDITDSRGLVIFTTDVKTDMDGKFSANTQIPKYYVGGLYEVLAQQQTTSEFDLGLTAKEFFVQNRSGFYKINTEDIEERFYLSSSSSLEPFFMKKSKTLGILLNDDSKSTGHLDLQIPTSMLGGELATSLGGNIIASELQKNSTYTKISLDYSTETLPSIIEISGTTAIPEFPVTILVLVASIASIIIVMKTRPSISIS